MNIQRTVLATGALSVGWLSRCNGTFECLIEMGPIGCSGLCGCISASRSRGLLEDALTQFADCHFPKNELPPKLFDLVFDFYFHWRPIAVQRRLRAFNAGALCRDFAGFVRSS